MHLGPAFGCGKAFEVEGGAVHAAVPLAGVLHIFRRQAAAVDRHTFARRVETAFEPVAVAQSGAGA